MKKIGLLPILVLLLCITALGCNDKKSKHNVYFPNTTPTPETPEDVAVITSDKLAYVIWDEGSNTDQVALFISESPDKDFKRYGIYNSPPALIEGLENGKRYWVTLIAHNALGYYSIATDPLSFMPNVAEYLPLPVTNLDVDEYDGRLEVEWGLAKYAESYNILLKAPNETEFQVIASTIDDEYLLTGLSNGEEYSIIIESVNHLGVTKSPAIVARPTAPRVLPSVNYFKSAIPKDSAIHLTWSKDSKASTYTIYLSESENGVANAMLTTSNTSVLLTNLRNDTPYWISISGNNSFGTSAASIPIKVTPIAALTKPRAPSNLAAVARSGAVELSWILQDGATNYKIYVTGSDNYSTATTTSESRIVINNLTNGVTYLFKVVASNAAGDSSGAEISSTPVAESTAPNAPLGFSAVAGNSTATLSWYPSLRANNYTIYAGLSESGTYTPIATVTDPNYIVRNLVNNQITWYKVVASNEAGSSAVSLAVSATPYLPLVAPISPGNISAIRGDSLVNLQWQPANFAAHYNVYISDSEGGTYAHIKSLSETNHQVNNLLNGQTYYFKISSQNDAGEGAQSLAVSATPMATMLPPATPQALNAIGNNGSVELTWSGAFGADNYIVYVSNSENGTYTALSTTKSTTTIVSSLQNDVAHWFKVMASNIAGNSSQSFAAQATPMAPANPPNTPSALSAVAGDSMVILKWNPALYAEHYNIYSSLTADGTYTLVTSTSNLNHTIIGEQNGITHYYKVAASNNNGESIKSQFASATPQALVNVPHEPIAVNAVAGDAIIEVSWATSDGAQSYIVYESIDNISFIPTASVNGLIYVSTGAINETTYFYKVKAINSAGASGFSTIVSATPTVVLPTPNAPTGLATISGDGSIYISWDDVTFAENFNIYLSTSDNGTYSLLASTVATFLRLSSQENDVTKYYRVSASNTSGASALSNSAYATPRAAVVAPLYPTAINATAGDTKVALSWSAAAGANNYAIYRSADNITFTPLVSVNSTSYLDINLANDQTYYYKIKSSNIAGTSDFSSVTVATPVASLAIPIPPYNLTASAGDAKIDLTWHKAPFATSYNIYNSATIDGTYSLVASTTLDYYTIIGLANNVTQYYKISATNSVGESNMSVVASSTPVATVVVPHSPNGVNITAGDSVIQILWSSSIGANSYVIYESTDNITFLPIASASGTTYLRAGLVNGQTYYYKIQATNIAGPSDFSSVISAQPKTTLLAPTQPHSLVAIAGNAKVDLTWLGVRFADDYTIHMSTSETGIYSPLATTTALRYTIDSLSNNTTYYFKVTARNIVGESVLSSLSFAKPAAPLVLPIAPTWQQAIAGDAQVVLVWQALPIVDSYIVYVSTDNVTFTALLSAPGLSYRHTGLTNGTTYYYKIAAVNIAGIGLESNVIIGTPYGAIPPVAPTLTSASPSNLSINLEWSFVPNAIKYNIYMKTEDMGVYSLVGTSVSGLTFTIPNLINGTKYWFKITAENSVGESTYSNEVAATPQTLIVVPPRAPTLTSATLSNLSVTLNWGLVSNATKYNIHMKIEDIGVYAPIPIGIGISGLSLTIPSLINNTKYWFKITAENSAGKSAYSNEIAITTPPIIVIPILPL